MSNVNIDIDVKKLPWGNTGFANIIKSNKVYIDKTRLIAEFAQLNCPCFLARPRRFGKSLLIDTIDDLFLNGLENFKNLDIEQTWTDTTYKILRIDFSTYASKNAKDLINTLNDELLTRTNLTDQIKNVSTSGQILEPSDIFMKICQKMSDESYVLLIDEYDAPITHHLDDPEELKKIVGILNNFYAAVKSCEKKFRFIFITGITRIAHVSIFSAFNNLFDLTLKTKYASLLGITNKELREYFNPYIERAANILSMSTDDVYAGLKARYDGFNFVIGSHETLYNPWSILSFLLSPEDGFKNYWFDSGGTPSILLNYLKINRNVDLWDYNNRQTTITLDELSAKNDIKDITPKLLLTQAGYFTLNGSATSYANLTFPNSEVEESMLRLYLTVNNIKVNAQTLYYIDKLVSYIDSHDLENIIKTFNFVINDCVSPKSKFFSDECTFRDLIYATIPNIPNLFKQKEREYTKGRSDLELITSQTHMVIEFKLTKSYRSAKKSLEEGLAQITAKHYGEALFIRKNLFRAVFVVSHKEKRILSKFSTSILD